MKAVQIIERIEAQRNEEQQQVLMRFFKTGKGDYGEGDEFLGLKVPQTRAIVKSVASDTPINEVPELLQNPWHEVRLCGLLILVDKFEKAAAKRLINAPQAIQTRDEIVRMYLHYADRANNWDLVDLSAPKIIGHWLLLPTALGGNGIGLNTYYKQQVLDELAASDCLWKQRISIVCTWKTSQQGELSWCWRYAEKHLHHRQDLMHKAVGWMLREMGKRDMNMLRQFLKQHAHEMPRTALRYAIEKMPEPERKAWMI
jgi:3-methyladenine DNA glycosylase AlkD